MDTSEIVPALLAGMSSAAVVLLGVWRMLAPNDRRYENAPIKPRDAITSAKTRLRQRTNELEARLHKVEAEFAKMAQRVETLEQVILPPATRNAK